MNSFITNALDFRSKRKCFSMAGCLIFVLLMSQASCRPSEIENESDDTPTYNDGDYTDVDDIEWQNFPNVETTTKFHPAIYYKEDFVSEDYDPNKEKKSSSTESDVDIKLKPRPRRKYKEISRRNRLNRNETYRLIKPEKVFFDILPTEDDGINKEEDAKFNEDVRIELVSLLDEEDDVESKHNLLSKRPKKYPHRHRERRDAKAAPSEETDETAKHALRHKRNPYFRYSFYGNQLPQYRGVFYQPQVVIYPVNRIKHPVKTHYINAVSPGGGGAKPSKRVTTTAAPSTAMPDLSNRFGEPVWGVYPASSTQRPQTTTRPTLPTTRPSRRPPPPLIHSGDEDYVPSESVIPSRPARPSESGGQGQVSFQRPAVPEEVYEAPPFVPQTTTTPPPPPANSRGVSACIWAISSCCTRNEKIRYQCFERLGCSGAFWDLNPCADDIFRLAVEAADQYFE